MWLQLLTRTQLRGFWIFWTHLRPQIHTQQSRRGFYVRTLSEFERGQRLINPPLLGDDKPSVLMSKMTALLGTHQPCFLFRALFLQRLPEFIQSTLVHSKVEDCQELAKAADMLWSTHQQTTNAVSTTSARSMENTGNANTMPKVCWYHRKFGENATRCSQPCTYTPSGNGKVGRQ